MSAIVKVGIIGFGYMGHFHFKRASEINGIEVVAVFDIDQEKRIDATENGILFCSTLEELLSLDIDLVIICTPNHTHKDLSITALNAGKNVLCEKPATLSWKEAKQVINVAEQKRLFFTVHQNRRWDKDYLCIQKVLRSGKIGQFTTINSNVFGQRGVCFGWRADPMQGGGMLYDWGAHLIDQILCLYPDRKVVEAYARLKSILTPEVDDYFEVKLVFDNKVCANINVGTFSLEPIPRWIILGDRGTLKLNTFNELDGGMTRIKKQVPGFDSVFSGMFVGPSRTMAPLDSQNIEKMQLNKLPDETHVFYSNLIKATLGEEKPIVSHAQILRLMKLIDNLFDSDRRHEIIKLSL